MELRVGDRVLYDGKRWLVASLGRNAIQREDGRMIASDESYAVLELESDRPGSQAHFSLVVPESRWDDVRLLEG